MQLTPRYDGPAVLQITSPTGDPAVPLLRQRQRLAEALATLDDAAWKTPSRCDAWSVKDVITHLTGTNQFWALSIRCGLDGEPTRFLTNFDPVSTPVQLVDAEGDLEPGEVLARFVASNEAIAGALEGVTGDAWATVAEAPPGHVSLYALTLHALWDSWIHERDVLLPLGVQPAEEADEVTGCLTYAAALGPAFAATQGSTRQGALVVDATGPAVRFVVGVGTSVVVHADGAAPAGAAVLTGDAVELVEAFSFRGPLVHDLGPDDTWLLGGLDEAFDTTRV